MADTEEEGRPFSRQHRRYWIPVTGGMILIMLINIAGGLLCWPDPPPPVDPSTLPVIPVMVDAGVEGDGGR